jgi:hypothetical protein
MVQIQISESIQETTTIGLNYSAVLWIQKRFYRIWIWTHLIQFGYYSPPVRMDHTTRTDLILQ